MSDFHMVALISVGYLGGRILSIILGEILKAIGKALQA